MLMTHTIWGTSWVDEMHEVIAYFAVGLVVPYCVLVGARSVQLIGLRWRRSFGKSRP
jgi:hypothetical protein